MNDVPFLEDFGPSEESVTPEEETRPETPDVLEKAKQYAILFAERQQLEEEIDDIKATMQAIEAEIAETMLFENPRIRVKVGENAEGKPVFRTVHVSTTIRASHTGDKDALIEAMKESGLEALVSETFNHNTLSAYVRGLDPDKKLPADELLELVPEAMKPHLKLTQTISLGCKA
jgi:hypothetical protein